MIFCLKIYTALIITQTIQVKSPLLRTCYIIAILLILSSTTFQILINFHQFNLISSIIILTLILTITQLAFKSIIPKTIIHQLQKDVDWFKKIFLILCKSQSRIFFCLIAASFTLQLARITNIPPVRWDSLTYHAVIPAIWVQTGAPIDIQAPGGFGNYLTFFSGAEIFLAWTMLPFKSDLLTGILEWFIWIFITISTNCITMEIKVRPAYSWLTAIFFVTIPAVKLTIGSAYIEPYLIISLNLGFLFSIRYFKNQKNIDLILAIATTAIAASTKAPILPIFILTTLILFIAIIQNALVRGRAWKLLKKTITIFLKIHRSENRNPKPGTRAPITINEYRDRKEAVHSILSPQHLILTIFLATIILAPWIIRNIQYTGYPLGILPLEVFGIKFGEANEYLKWYQDRPIPDPYHIKWEISTLFTLFNVPWKLTRLPHFTFPTLLMFILALSAIIIKIRTLKLISILTLGIIAINIYSVYNPEFTIIRLYWPTELTRFLIPAAAVAIPYSFSLFSQQSKANFYLAWFIKISIILHLTSTILYGCYEAEIIPALLTTLIISATIILTFHIPILSKKNAIPIFIFLLILPHIILPIIKHQRAELRYPTFKYSILTHYHYNYYFDAAEKLDEPDQPKSIAITSGSDQDHDNWFIYPFLGSNFQNKVNYIPVGKTEKIIQMDKHKTRIKSGDYQNWFKRLKQNKTTHIVSFKPKGIEHYWMQNNPKNFQPIEATNDWGVYQIKY